MKIHALLFLALMFLPMRFAFADGEAGICSFLFASAGKEAVNFQEITDALASILRYPANKKLEAKLKTMDAQLVVYLQGLLRELPPERQHRVLNALWNARNVKDKASQKIGGIVISPEEITQISYNGLMRKHMMLRLDLVHELTHFIRFDELGDVSPQEAYNYQSWLLKERNLGTYFEEGRAYGNEYDFIRMVFTQEDLPFLERVYSFDTVDGLKNQLYAQGILKQEVKAQVTNPDSDGFSGGDVRIRDVVVSKMAKTSEQKKLLQEYVSLVSNRQLVKIVRLALTNSKKDFLVSKLDRPNLRMKNRERYFKRIFGDHLYKEWLLKNNAFEARLNAANDPIYLENDDLDLLFSK